MKKCLVILFFPLISNTVFAQNDQLEYYLTRAISNSPLLNDYQGQIQSGFYDSLLIRAAYKPQVTGSSINSYSPVYKGWGYDAAVTNGGNFNALLVVNKQVLNTKVVTAQFQNLQLQNLALNNNYKITEQEIKRAVTSQYIIAFGDLQILKINKEINRLLTGAEVILKKLTQQNVYKQVDYLSFLVTLQQQELLIKQQEIQYKYDYAGLNYLVGVTDTVTIELQKPDIRSARLPDISQSVFFKRFELDSLKLHNNKTMIAIGYKPRINLYADAGFLSSLALNPYKNFGTSFGFSAVIPIYDGMQKKLQYSKIDILEKTRERSKSFYSNQYQQQIAQLTQHLKATEEQITNINTQLKYAQRLIEVNGKLLEAGEAKITDYILALNNYIMIKTLVTQNNISRLQLINQINYWNR